MLYRCDTDIELNKFEDQLKDIKEFYYEIMGTKNKTEKDINLKTGILI